MAEFLWLAAFMLLAFAFGYSRGAKSREQSTEPMSKAEYYGPFR